MLALDSTIGCIEASESEIVDLYRSAAITRSPSPDARPETMETYLCAIRKKPQQVKVYLAFVVNDRKIYVYTSPGKGKSEADYPEEVEEALGYAADLGFSLERVDLSYSPAMREVVVRNTKILRLPGSKAKSALKHGLAGAPVLPMPRSAAKRPDKEPAPPPSPTRAPAHAPAAAAPAKKEASGGAEPGKEALAELKQERQALLAERDALANQLGHLSVQHHDSAAELASLKESYAQLAAESETLLPLRQQVAELLPAKDAEIARLQDQVGDLGRKLELTAGRRAELQREQGASEEKLAGARQEMAALAAERDSERESAANAQRALRDATAQLDQMRQELGALQSEAERASQRAGELEARKSSLESELDGVRQELAGVAAEKDAAVKRLAVLEERQGPGEAEIVELRRELAQTGAARDAALEQAANLQGQHGEAQQETTALRRELEELRAELRRVTEEKQQAAAPAAAERALSEQRQQEEELFPPRILQGLQDSAFDHRPAFAESTLPAFQDLEAPQEEHAWDAPEPAQQGGTPSAAAVDFPPLGEPGAGSFFVPLGELQGGFFSGEDEAEAVRFHLENGLTAIDCPSPEQVLELHHSINNAYLSPEGTGGQESCQGYICCLRGNDDQRSVFAAIYGTTSRRTRVYLPETQPRDDESYARTVRGAVSFAEEVGLMMERVPLEADASKREERLKRCPVLRMAQGK